MLFRDLENPHKPSIETEKLFKNDLKTLLLTLFDKKLTTTPESYLNPNSEEFKGEIYFRTSDPRNGRFATVHINLEEFGFENLNDLTNFVTLNLQDYIISTETETLASDAFMFFPYIKNEQKQIAYTSIKQNRVTVKFVLNDYDLKCLSANYYINGLKTNKKNVVY